MSTDSDDRASPILEPHEPSVKILKTGHNGSDGGYADESICQQRMEDCKIMEQRQGHAQNQKLEHDTTFSDEAWLNFQALLHQEINDRKSEEDQNISAYHHHRKPHRYPINQTEHHK